MRDKTYMQCMYVHTRIGYVIAVIVGTLQYHHEMRDACINMHMYEAYDALCKRGRKSKHTYTDPH